MSRPPGGTSISGGRGGEVGGLDLASSMEAKFGVKSPNKRKTWEVLVPQEAKLGT